jgi:hypothetical protein
VTETTVNVTRAINDVVLASTETFNKSIEIAQNTIIKELKPT